MLNAECCNATLGFASFSIDCIESSISELKNERNYRNRNDVGQLVGWAGPRPRQVR